MSNENADTKRPALKPTILGEATGTLALRFQGSPRDGQVVRLDGEKCAIGSGQNCALRLEASGIHAVHCYILRGKNETIVRRWSPDTRLNGRTFRDAPLRGGDRLSIGSIEFEVMAEETTAPDRLAATADERRQAELSQRLNDLEQERAKYANDHEQASARIQQREADLFRREELLQNQERLLEIREDELEQLRTVTQQKQDELETEAQESARGISEQRQLIKCEQEQLQARIDAFESRQREMEAERGTLQEQLEALAIQRDELADREQQLQTLHETAQAELEEQQNRLAERTEQFDRHARECEIELKQQREAIAQTKAEAQAKFDEAANRQAQAEALREQYEQERDKLEAEREEFAQRHQQLEEEFASRRQEIESQQTSAQTEQLQHKFTEQTQALESLRIDLEQREDAFATSRNAWSQQRESLEREIAELRTAADEQTRFTQELREAVEQSHSAPQPPTETIDESLLESQDEATEQPTLEDAPVNEALATLARLREQALAEDDYEDNAPLENYSLDGMSESFSGEPSHDDSLEHSAGYDQVPALDDSLSGGDAGDDDVSIQDYMGQLMQRIQGKPEVDAGLASRSVQQTESKELKTPSPESPVSDGATRQTAELNSDEPQKSSTDAITELNARNTAPEQASILRAMRELANESARNAITASSEHQAAGKVRGKFAIALASAVTGVVMLTLHSGLFSLPVGIALLCFASTGWFAYNAFKCRKHLLADSNST